MSEFDPSLLPSRPEQESGSEEFFELFPIVAQRLEEGLERERQDPQHIYVSIDANPDPQNELAIAKFTLVENLGQYLKNRGEVLEIEVPTYKIGDKYSALLVLHPLNQGNRFFIVRHFEPGKYRAYKFTDTGVGAERSLSWQGFHRRRNPDSYREKLQKFEIVTRRPRSDISTG